MFGGIFSCLRSDCAVWAPRRLLVADSRAPRNGAFVEEIGYFNPIAEPVELKVDNEKAAQWIKNGAQPTDTVRDLLKKTGAID